MVSKTDFMDVGVMALGAAAGAAVSHYGSNAISDALTQSDRDAGTAPAEIAFWRKAPAVDIGLGVVVGALGLYAVKGSSRGAKMTSLGLKSAAAFLVANGVMDLVGDMLVAEGDARTVNGRPLRYVGEGAARVSVGALRRNAMSRPVAQRLSAQQFVPAGQRGRTAIY